MARKKGSSNLAASLEVLAGAPLDARTVVDSKSDLTTAATFSYYYVGMPVYVIAESKMYVLTGSDPTVATNWKELGSGGGGGTTPAGLVIDATLLASGWNASNQQTLTFTGYDSAMGGVIGMPIAATSAQKEAYAEAVINVVSQSGTSFTFEAETVPSVDLPVTLYAGGADGSGGGAEIEVDDSLSPSSENPVQNKVVKAALDEKMPYTPSATTSELKDNDRLEAYCDRSTESSPWTGFRSILWSNVKTTLKAYFDTLYSTVKTRGTPASGGTALSLVTTGDMYNWNNPSISIVANQFEKSDLYSTTEKVVGCWTDSKPLYQKTFLVTVAPNSESTFKPLEEISTLDSLISCEIIANESGSYTQLPFIDITKGDTKASYAIKGRANEHTVAAFTQYILTNNRGTADTFAITIRYTKTTDAANSFKYADENDYSTTEHIVGSWIDGKPVYQKTISKTGLTASNPITINFSEISTNLKQLIKDDICGINPSTNGSIVIPAMIDPTNNKKLDAQYNGTNKYLSITSDLGSPWNVYATFQYTKTTD